MTPAAGLRAALAVAVALALAGCANLSSFVGKPDADRAAAAPSTVQASYRFDVQAPAALRTLLLTYLDLARFQNAPALDAINDAELERLMRAAPAQARGLLETEGYFNAQVAVTRSGTDGDVPLLRMDVEPGPRAVVDTVRIDAVGELQDGVAAGNGAAVGALASWRGAWLLRRGDAFRQSAWTDAKFALLARVRADGYAAASWRSTAARVDAPDNRVELSLLLDSGPRFRLGEIRVEGLARYDEAAVRRLADFNPGDPYSEQRLLDFQDRLQKLGLFEGATVELDADPALAQAAPVRVRVTEQPLQQATVGVGYSANTGARLSVEHTHRRVFGSRWIANNKFQLGPDQQAWEGELSSHPLDNLYRNLVSGSATRLRTDDQLLLGWNARIGRIQDTPRVERLYFAELTHDRVDGAVLTTQADAASLNHHWVFRDLDNALLPTRGLTTSAQVGLGFAQGSRSVLGEPLARDRGPFARLYARLTWYRPFGGSWYGSARIEAGQVLTRNVIGVPDTLLFRAGGDDSVRGYGYRTLGPTIDGATTSGRSLLTGSVEIARPISPNRPAIWWATFIDAGNAADRFSDLRPAFGYGVGLRWRSPVGPLRVDLAYGERVRQVRVHLSVGIAF